MRLACAGGSSSRGSGRGWRQRAPAVGADGHHATVLRLRRMVPHVQHQPAVRQLDDLAFVGAGVRGGADGPVAAAVVAVDDVRAVDAGPGLGVVRGHDEAAGAGLDADARPGRVPRPLRPLDAGGDLGRCRPRRPVVRALHHPDRAGGFAGAGDDVLFAIGAAVLRGEQPERAGLSIEDRARVADGVRAVVADDLQGRPGAPVVATPLENQVDVAGIARAGPPRLSERQQRAVATGDQRRDSKRVIPGLTRLVDLGERQPRHGRLARGEDERTDSDDEPRARETHAMQPRRPRGSLSSGRDG